LARGRKRSKKARESVWGEKKVMGAGEEKWKQGRKKQLYLLLGAVKRGEGGEQKGGPEFPKTLETKKD